MLTPQQLHALDGLLQQAHNLLARIEALNMGEIAAPDWQEQGVFAWHYRKRSANTAGYLHPIRHPHSIGAQALLEVEPQKKKLFQNTAQFVAGKHANNVLLTGAKGTGKSSLIKACLLAFADQGLRLIEVDKDDMGDLPELLELLRARPERFIIFCDDLSFEAGEMGYKALKSVLDGSLSGAADNVLVYASSNRRHLLPESMQDNASYQHTSDGEVHPGEAIEEKISLSERFGLWLSFYPFSQTEYLSIVRYWLKAYAVPDNHYPLAEREALQWALQRGSRSGRVANQFARDYAGRWALSASSKRSGCV